MLWKTPVKISHTAMSTLLPVYIESYRILYVGPQKQVFNRYLDIHYGIYELALSITFLSFIVFNIIFNRISLSGDSVKTNLASAIWPMICGCFGQGYFQKPKFVSVGFLYALYSIFMYIYFVMQSGIVIRTITTISPSRYRSFKSVQDSNIKLFATKYDQHLDVYKQLQVRWEILHFLGKNVLSITKFSERIWKFLT